MNLTEIHFSHKISVLVTTGCKVLKIYLKNTKVIFILAL